MKISTLILVALLCGCASPYKSSYRDANYEELQQRNHRNQESRDYAWNEWRYAGSDQQYDYIYEYDPGAAFPAHSFRYYKIPLHELDMQGSRYPFDPDLRNNRSLSD